MLDTFKARLKAKTKASGVNLSQKRIDAYADRLHKKNPDVKEDSEHDTLIDALDELVVFADVAKEDDQARTKDAQIKKLSEKKPDSEKENEETEEEEDEEEDETPKGKKKSKQEKEKPSGRMPKWFKEYADKVDLLVGEKSEATIKSRIADKLKGEDGNAKVPERFWIKRPLPKKDEELEAFITEVEEDWAEITKDNPVSTEKVEKPVNGHKPNRGGKQSDKASEKETDAILDNIVGPAAKK